MLWLDRYERRARLAPGLLALLPVAFTAIAVGLRDLPVGSALIGLLVSVGGPIVLATVVRDRGLKCQESLYCEWDGAPTTQLLRVREAVTADPDRDRRRQLLSEVTGLALPELGDEERSQVDADQRYEAAVQELRTRTRDSEDFPLVFAENMNFGFLRNARGVRSLGIAIAAVCAVGSGAASWYALAQSDAPFSAMDTLASAGLAVVWAFGWFRLPTKAQVRRAGERYASELFAALPVLRSPNSSQ